MATDLLAAIQPFPDNCQHGILQLEATRYSVRKSLLLEGECTIKGQAGTILELEAPITTQGNLHLTGSLEIAGHRQLKSACLTVEGNMSIKMHTLVVKNCHSKGEGGALHVSGNLLVVGGKLTFQDCQARSGGAVWASGTAHGQSLCLRVV